MGIKRTRGRVTGRQLELQRRCLHLAEQLNELPFYAELMGGEATQLILELREDIAKVIIGLEEGDQAWVSKISHLDKHLPPGREITVFAGGEFKRITDVKGPLPLGPAAFVLDSFLKWFADHRDTFPLGVCRHCGKIYLKGKFSRKQRYCSDACKQAAYRLRKTQGSSS